MSTRIKLKSLKTNIGLIENLEVVIGRIWEDTLVERAGPTPFPSMADLRDWDSLLLKRYRPLYSPTEDVCSFCAFGKCDLTRRKKGACGIDIETHQARLSALNAVIGAAAHATHARHTVEHLVKKYGRDSRIYYTSEVELEAPLIRLICGIKPRVLGDLEMLCDYIDSQISQVLCTVHTGQEGEAFDFESKALHVGMIDNLALEVADLAQTTTYNFPKGDPEAELTEIGLGVVDVSKPVIIGVGHNVAAMVEAYEYARENGLVDKVELCGLCCTGHDASRHTHGKAKIVGPISSQARVVRLGIADVLVIDEQCVRVDLLHEAKRVRTPVVTTRDVICLGLKDRTGDPVDEIVEDLVSERVPGVMILDPCKAGEVAVKVAVAMAPKRSKVKAIPSEKEEVVKWAKKCTKCLMCQRNCPINLAIPEAMVAAREGDFGKLIELHEVCLACLKCESACPEGIPVLSLMEKADEIRVQGSKFKIRVGRGPILDVEIRDVGSPIVLGEIPGVIGFAGCANFPQGPKEVALMAEELVKRKYIVCASGCAAMAIAMHKDEEGKTLYEKYPGTFDAGGLVNVGSCVANSHIAGAAVKIANIFARRPLKANFEEIADYIINRVGACGIVWGIYSQKAFAISAGFNRLGIPVIWGPAGAKFRRQYLGKREEREDWQVYDARTGDKVYVGHAPEHLLYVAESIEEVMVMAAKLCMRPNDTLKGRNIKLTHYIDLHKRFYGKLPDDLPAFIRHELDIPIIYKQEILEAFKEQGISVAERAIPDPTLLERLVRARKR